MRWQIVCFDLDGTLVDTASEIAEAANRALEVHGLARRPVAEITRLIGGGARELTLKLLARALLDQPDAADRVRPEHVLASMDEHYAVTTGTTGRPYPGAHHALQSLRQGGVRVACVTNKESRHAERVLRAHRLDGCFDLVVGGDTLPVKKPDAGVLRHVVRHLRGQAGRTAHVGDSRVDVDAARAAGVAAWAVPYGYNAGEPIAAARPDRMFESLDEVARHVLGEPDGAGVAAAAGAS
ncbi:MAG: HAD-IA family hydrolase [Rubrivivax sp.]|nr:HAD-IA family hydrolase [Rubrivivax sp.]